MGNESSACTSEVRRCEKAPVLEKARLLPTAPPAALTPPTATQVTEPAAANGRRSLRCANVRCWPAPPAYAVDAGAAGQQVVAVLAGQRVGVLPAHQDVVAGAA